MPVSFQEIIGSRLVKFVVGETVDGYPTGFSVHEEAIAKLSDPLRTLTQSGPEARAGEVEWKDVSKDTFGRFVQYAYTGDYSIPKTEKRSAITSPKTNGVHKYTNGVESSEKADNGTPQFPPPNALNGVNGGIRERFDSLESEEKFEVRDGSIPEKLDDDGTILNQPTLPPKKHKKKKAARAAFEKAEREAAQKSEKEASPETEPAVEELSKTEPDESQPAAHSEPELTPEVEIEQAPEMHVLAADFSSLSYPVSAPRDSYEGTCEPLSDFNKEHSYSDVLLSHASLYVLGNKQLIDNLKALALSKLHKTLCTIELDNHNIGDITDLARYAYSEEDKGATADAGGLRGLVCQYMALHAKELSTDAKFMNLLVGGGQIVQDFIKLQLQRVN